MKIKTYITLDDNTSSLLLNQLKELYSIVLVESEYIILGEEITKEYFDRNIAIDWHNLLPFVVIDGKAIGTAHHVMRKFIKDGLISSSSFQSAKGA